MANRSVFDDLFDLSARVSVWHAAMLSASLFLACSVMLPAAIPDPWRTAFAPVLTMVGGLLAFASVLGVLAGRLTRSRQRSVYQSQRSLASIRSLNWRDFEHLMVEAFRRQGFVPRLNTGGPDGGVDIRLSQSNETTLVQCKQWRSSKVGVGPVRELAGVMAAERAAGGILVCSGDYTSEARSFAERAGIRLIDGQELAMMLEIDEAPADTESAPVCPRCGGTLVRRVARRGPKAGSRFLGCSSFPRCRHTQNLQPS